MFVMLIADAEYACLLGISSIFYHDYTLKFDISPLKYTSVICVCSGESVQVRCSSMRL